MKYTLLYNGQIYPLDSDRHFDWILIDKTRIARLGQKADRPALSGQTFEQIDLRGGTVIPAFGDGHLHLVATALKMEQIDLEPCTSVTSVLELLSGIAPINQNDWILGTGYNRNLWGGIEPHRSQLDKRFPDNPVALASKDLHSLWINSAALKHAGISRHTPDPPNGKIVRDEDGHPTGILYESACEKVFPLFNEVTPERFETLLHRVSQKFYAYGITSVNAIEEISTWKYLQILNTRHALPLRITCHLPERHLDPVIQSGMVSGFGNSWLRLGGIKFFMDGSLGSQTADLFDPYDSNPEYRGISMMEEKELILRVRKAAENGLSSTIHAIGDRAIHKTLNAFDSARGWQEKFRLRQRLEHAQLIHDSDLPRFKAYNIIASMQPAHIADDVEIANLHWGSRSRNAYPVRSLIDQGIIVAFGSDSPVTDPDPFKGLYSAVRRKYLLDPQSPSWYPEQAISVTEAVKAYTSGVAEASCTDVYTGTLSPGKFADLILLDRNIFESPPEELLKTRVLLTILNGTIVYSRI